MESHYDILDVSEDADLEEITAAYRELLKDNHPDLGGSREAFLRIKDAYESITGQTAPRHRGVRGLSTDEIDPTFAPPDHAAFGTQLTVSGEYLTLSLVAVVQELELASVVDAPGIRHDVTHSVAFFEVRNTSSRTLPWRGCERTRFIGDDGFMYEASSIIEPHSQSLPGRWFAGNVDIPAGRALEAVVVADMPADVSVEKVVYSQDAYASDGKTVHGTERYLFELRRRIRDALDDLPFETEEAADKRHTD